MTKSWKTTVSGIAAIVTALAGAATAIVNGAQPDWTSIIAAILAGIGLITAKDSKVTGGNIQQ